jgi:hypothetical protein
MKNWTDERGTALLLALLATMLVSALGVALVLTTATETFISANYRGAQEVLYAADAGLERSIQDLLQETNWNGVLAGTNKSSFTDAGGARLPDGSPVDLDSMTAVLQGDSDATYGNVPNRPIWRIYSHAPLDALLATGTISTRAYVLVWVGDDPAETDGDPSIDSNGIVFMRAEAFGQNGGRKIVEATVRRNSIVAGDEGYNGQRGQDERNQRRRAAAIQTPGGSLTEMRMNLATGGMVVQ